MNKTMSTNVRLVTEAAEGYAVATVDLPATAERIFRAISTSEVTQWWVRPGVFDTREFAGDVRVGGRWRASGIARGRPYILEGKYLTVVPNREIVYTWEPVSPAPGPSTTVAYRLEPIDGGTRLTVRHSGMASAEACAANGIGWQTSLERLFEILTADAHAAQSGVLS